MLRKWQGFIQVKELYNSKSLVCVCKCAFTCVSVCIGRYACVCTHVCVQLQRGQSSNQKGSLSTYASYGVNNSQLLLDHTT